MIEIAENYRINNTQTVKTEIAEFLVEQRNEGFAKNDGAWIVSQLPALYWSPGGVLRSERPGKFLGAHPTKDEAVRAIEGAELQPVNDHMIH